MIHTTLQALHSLMTMNPDLPVEIITNIGPEEGWHNVQPAMPAIEYVSHGCDGRVYTNSEDASCDPDASKWVKSIVLRVI